MGDGCNLKGQPLALPHVEVQGAPPPWRKPSEGEGLDCTAPPAANKLQGFPP